MKNLLIYGDSNVWGDNFIEGRRIPRNKQWVHILKEQIGNEYEIYQEGLPGRVAGNCDLEKPFKNGKDTFMAIFRTCAPLDVVLIALGTNDLQVKYQQDSQQIVDSLLWYQQTIKNLYADEEDRKKFFVFEKMPRIIYLLPPNFMYQSNGLIFNSSSEENRQAIIRQFQIMDVESIIIDEVPLFEDGVHFNYDGHQKVADVVKEVLMKDE